MPQQHASLRRGPTLSNLRGRDTAKSDPCGRLHRRGAPERPVSREAGDHQGASTNQFAAPKSALAMLLCSPVS
jgi:hypothetical protein